MIRGSQRRRGGEKMQEKKGGWHERREGARMVRGDGGCGRWG